jgi:aminoglycoside phosphotransferase (APT) family kinase protein
MFEQAIEALVVTHRIPWEAHLPGWAEPRTLRTEVAAWERALGKADDPEWISQGLELRDRLLAALPLEPAPGVVHGDFYPTNWLFDDGRLTAVVDWEIAAIGPTLLDLGWLCMMQDPASWAPSLAPPTAWHGDPEDLITLYEKLSGSAVPDLAWYRALAAWRFGAIIALNVHLHRSGRRHDPVWELMAESFPALIDRGLQLLRP